MRSHMATQALAATLAYFCSCCFRILLSVVLYQARQPSEMRIPIILPRHRQTQRVTAHPTDLDLFSLYVAAAHVREAKLRALYPQEAIDLHHNMAFSFNPSGRGSCGSVSMCAAPSTSKCISTWKGTTTMMMPMLMTTMMPMSIWFIVPMQIDFEMIQILGHSKRRISVLCTTRTVSGCTACASSVDMASRCHAQMSVSVLAVCVNGSVRARRVCELFDYVYERSLTLWTVCVCE